MSFRKSEDAPAPPAARGPSAIFSSQVALEVIELSSDSESDNEAEIAGSQVASSTKRKASAEGEDSEMQESPGSKKQKLVMGVNASKASTGGHRETIEIPDSEFDPEEEIEPASEAMSNKASTHVHINDDGNSPDEAFYTPLEGPTKNPLETAMAVASAPPLAPVVEEELEALGNSGDEDDDEPPEAVSTSAAAAQTFQSVQIAAKAAKQ